MSKLILEDGKVTIPETPEDFAEALLDDEWRKAAFGEAKNTQEVLAAYNKMVNKAENIAKATTEQMQAVLTGFLKDNGVTDLPTKADIDKLIPEIKGEGPLSGVYNKFAPGAELDSLGINGVGELANLIIRDARRDSMSPESQAKIDKMRQVQAAYSSTDPESAGFLIPEEQRANLLSLALEQSVVRSRATTIQMSSKTVDIPFVDVTSHASSLFGGMIFYWTEESGALTNTEAKFGKVRLENNKLTGGARIPNELLADAPALSTFLNAAMPAGIAYFEDDAFINGSGVGEPLGFLGSPALIQVTRGTTDEVNIADIANMYSRMLPQSLGSAVWVINQTVLPEIIQLTLSNDAIGLIGDDATRAPVMSLLGRPVVVSEKVPALANGAGNDILLVDFSYYLVGDRQSVTLDSSGHSRFSNDETELRIIERVDGRPWIQSALTPKNGSTLSPIVGLAD